MFLSDFYAVIQWWFVIFIIGLGFLPVTILLFNKFFDKGYIFAKILGIAIISYVIFIFGILHILPFTFISSLIISALTAGAFFLLLPQKWKVLYALKTKWLTFLLEELLFFIALLSWSYVHGFQPDIHGLEKYMDFGFINSILRAEYFPPKDMWFTPLSINYYYFGHLMTAVVTKLSHLPSSLTFNLMLATIFAFCFTQTFSLGANLYTFLRENDRIAKGKRIIFGLLTACLVSLAGNLHILYGFFKAYPTDQPLPFWQLQFLPNTFPNSYWYPNATRFIYHTIHEFPIYSWVVADLHGHVLDIPFVLLMIALLLSLFMSYNPAVKTEDEKKINHLFSKGPLKFLAMFLINPFILILIGFLLAIMYMTNAWDGAIYLILTAIIILYLHWQERQEDDDKHKEESVKIIKNIAEARKKISFSPKKSSLLAVRDFLLSFFVILLSFIIFTFPYNYFFDPFVSGIGVLCSPDFLIKIGQIGPFLFEKDRCQHSFWWELLTLYGFFYFFVLSFLVVVMRAKKIYRADIFVLLLIILATLLILIPEFIYVKDIYPAHYRANTMFKLVFQSFIMLALSSGYIIARLLNSSLDDKRGIYRAAIFPILSAFLVALVLYYPYIAVSSYYNNFKEYKGLNGTAYLKTLSAPDAEGIFWLNKHVSGQPVILEAQGDSYTDFARVSANTGLPTVLGWTVHEWLWRGSYDIPAPRINEIKTLYETTDTKVAIDLIKKYKVQYVFIGAKEFEKYPTLSEAKFTELGKVIFSKGTTKIYKINR